MRYYDYETFKKDTRLLLGEVQTFGAQAIVCIARGGFTLTHALSEGLDIREVHTIRTELYDKTQRRSEITLHAALQLHDFKRVLVVDDIADSGETLRFVMEYLAHHFCQTEFRSATLFYKKTSCYEPHYWINEADDWIDFFWERDFLPKE